jgi:Selenocysteine lyase
VIYLDNAATTFPKPSVVLDAVDNANRNLAFNAGRGAYDAAGKCSALIEETRLLLGNVLAVNADAVVFSSSATEAINQIIYGLPLEEGDAVLVSPFEHNAIMRPLHLLQKEKKIDIIVLPFDENWQFSEAELQNIVTMNSPKAVLLSQISNVTGFILPYQQIFEQTPASIHILDASQGFGIIPIEKAFTDYVVFAGHKALYSTFGIAGFAITGKDVLKVVKAGGTGSDSLNLDMPTAGHTKYEAGSPNINAIAGLNAALKWINPEAIKSHEDMLLNYLIERIEKLPRINTFCPPLGSHFGILSFTVLGYQPDEVGQILNDEFEICVRTGFHCAPLVHEFLDTESGGGTIRVSLSLFTTLNDLDSLLDALKTL